MSTAPLPHLFVDFNDGNDIYPVSKEDRTGIWEEAKKDHMPERVSRIATKKTKQKPIVMKLRLIALHPGVFDSCFLIPTFRSDLPWIPSTAKSRR